MERTIDKKYFRITKDMKNHFYDKRCKYGINSVSYFKEGKIFCRTTEEVDIGTKSNVVEFYSVVIDGCSVRLSRHMASSLSLDEEYAKCIEDMENVFPLNISEAADLAETSVDDLVNTAVNQLLKDGVITPSQLLAASRKYWE